MSGDKKRNNQSYSGNRRLRVYRVQFCPDGTEVLEGRKDYQSG